MIFDHFLLLPSSYRSFPPPYPRDCNSQKLHPKSTITKCPKLWKQHTTSPQKKQNTKTPNYNWIKASKTSKQTNQSNKQTNKNNKKTVESIICWSATLEHAVFPGMVDTLIVIKLENTKFPSPRTYSWQFHC